MTRLLPRVVFVSGAGRSGSTLLDRLLGRAEGACSVGELAHIWGLGFGDDQFCGCGQPFRQCPFWIEVIGRAFGGFGAMDAPRLERDQEAFLRIRHLPALAQRRIRPAGFRASLAEWHDIYARLLVAISDVSGCNTVIDSSKNPMYGLLLASMPGIEMRTVHLVRDSRAVAFSWASRLKADPMHAGRYQFALAHYWQAASWWDVSNVLSEAAPPLRRRSMRIRYEDLAREPGRNVDRLCRFAGLPPIQPAEGEETFDLGVAHTVGGNPMRFQQGAVRVKPDTEWRTAMAPRARRQVTALTWPLLLRYRYRIR